jgi:hypothetical protein
MSTSCGPGLGTGTVRSVSADGGPNSFIAAATISAGTARFCAVPLIVMGELRL